MHDSEPIDIVLKGGPSDIPESARTLKGTRAVRTVKLPRLGGYEHFEAEDSGAATTTTVVYRWTRRTKIAE
jgi:hypothetical protein